MPHDKVVASVERIRDELFSFKIDTALAELQELMDELESIVENCSKEQQEYFNTLIGCLNIALENRDYLMIADIIKFDFAAIDWGLVS